MGKAKSKTSRHNTDAKGGKSFTKRGHTTLGAKYALKSIGPKGQLKVTNNPDGSKTIRSIQTVSPKTKGASRKDMATGSAHNTSTTLRNTRAHIFADSFGGGGGKRNLIMTSEAVNKGDTFAEAGQRSFMNRPGKPGPYQQEVTANISADGRRTEMVTNLARKDSFSMYSSRVASKTG